MTTSVRNYTLITAVLMAVGFTTPTTAQMGSTTGTIDTRVGKIELDKGLPANEAVEQKIYDEMDFQRATQVYIWALPIVAFNEWQRANRKVFGAIVDHPCGLPLCSKVVRPGS